MKISKMKPIHPGEILLEEFLEPMNISQYKSIRIEQVVVHDIPKQNKNY